MATGCGTFAAVEPPGPSPLLYFQSYWLDRGLFLRSIRGGAQKHLSLDNKGQNSGKSWLARSNCVLLIACGQTLTEKRTSSGAEQSWWSWTACDA